MDNSVVIVGGGGIRGLNGNGKKYFFKKENKSRIQRGMEATMLAQRGGKRSIPRPEVGYLKPEMAFWMIVSSRLLSKT